MISGPRTYGLAVRAGAWAAAMNAVLWLSAIWEVPSAIISCDHCFRMAQETVSEPGVGVGPHRNSAT